MWQNNRRRKLEEAQKNVLVIKFFTFMSLQPFESRAPFQHQNLKMADSADVTASLHNLAVI